MSPARPNYDAPPVIEVVCGLTFDALQAIKAPHLGLYWAKIRDQYPDVEHRDPLGVPDGLLHELPLPRVWFIHKSGNFIIQVQADRFIFNWRKQSPSDKYPRYPEVVKGFKEEISKFREFLIESKLGELVPKALELTYVNHIERVGEHQPLAQINKVFPDLTWRAGNRFLAEPQSVVWQATFGYPEADGRLVADMRSATRKADNMSLYVLELKATAKLRDGNAGEESLKRAFSVLDKARDWIVKGFDDLTAAAIQETVWKRR